jgi:hypothetical protein
MNGSLAMAGAGRSGGGSNQIDLGGIYITIQGNADAETIRPASREGVMEALRAVGIA